MVPGTTFVMVSVLSWLIATIQQPNATSLDSIILVAFPLERRMCRMVVVSSELTVAFHWKGWSIALFEMLMRLRMELMSTSLLFQVIAADR